VALAFLVVRQRQAHKVTLGHGNVPELERASRTFGNAIEYVPAAIGGLALLALIGAPASALHVIGGGLFVARVAHAVGLSRNSGVSAGRFAGTALTWTALIALGAALVAYALT
jgi:uncharacterized membrane protein YecN with MAPEG domain